MDIRKSDIPMKKVNVVARVKLATDHIYDKFKNYTDGVRVLFLIHRNKEGGATNNTKVRKVITKNTKEFYEELYKLVEEKQNTKDIPYRIYSSVNARDIKKAIRKFKFDQLEADYYDEESSLGFYYDIKNRFISALMIPASRQKETNYFILDVDNEEGRDVNGECLMKLAEINVEIVDMFATKNGSHIIVKPFNPSLFDVPGVGIHKDGLLLLDF